MFLHLLCALRTTSRDRKWLFFENNILQSWWFHLGAVWEASPTTIPELDLWDLYLLFYHRRKTEFKAGQEREKISENLGAKKKSVGHGYLPPGDFVVSPTLELALFLAEPAPAKLGQWRRTASHHCEPACVQPACSSAQRPDRKCTRRMRQTWGGLGASAGPEEEEK